jgi:hypothetical protein
MKALLLVSAFLAAAAQAQTYRLSGTVTAAGAAVAGAQIHAGDALGVCGPDGRFALNVPSGGVDLTIDGPPGGGYLQQTFRGVNFDRDMEMRVALQRPVRISGFVVANDGTALQPIVELRSLTNERTWRAGPPPDGSFNFDVPPDVYAIEGIGQFPRYRSGRVNVDARTSDVSGVRVPIALVGEALPRFPPPVAAKISVSAADGEGMATITGAAGAADSLAAVAVANLLTNQMSVVVSRPDGGFTVRLFAPPGSVLEIKHDPTGRFIAATAGPNNVFEGAAGTIVQVPAPPGTFATMQLIGIAGGNQFQAPTLAAVFGNEDRFILRISGALSSKRDYSPGDTFSLSGTLALYGSPLPDPPALTLRANLLLARYFDAAGKERRLDNDFVTGVLTPTGLPLGYSAQMMPINAGSSRLGTLARAGNHLEATYSDTATLPKDLPPGVYRVVIALFADGLAAPARSFDAPATLFTISEFRPAALPTIRVGQPKPPKLAWALLLDDFSNGSRGAVAEEDRAVFGIASHVITNNDTFILPRVEERSGAAIRYRLEPFAPMLSRSAGNGTLAEVPHVPLKFPSGSLQVRVTKPDGTIDDLGAAPFAQALLRTPVTRALSTMNDTSFHVSDFLQLTTLDPRFDYEFRQYGRHVVTMTGSIEDLDGNIYQGGGNYEVFVARPLDLDAAVLPGTPFQVGDAFSPMVTIQPGVAADVEVRVQLLPGSNAAAAIRQTFTGRANRFGAFIPRQAFGMTAAGEYRVDVVARYTDADGSLWMGAETLGGIVETPGSPLLAHGRRGFDLSDRIQDTWFHVPQARTGGDHVMFPFNTGDIMWMTKFDPAADIPKITVQDPVGPFSARVLARSRSGPRRWEQPWTIETRLTAGEIPLFSSVAAGKPQIEPENVDQWGYFYSAANRPGVHVRELVSGDQSGSGYWRFTGDTYGLQLGTGIGGDLPNDFKFQFGGAVYRDESDGFRWYGGYASLFVMLPFEDRDGRVFPPFQGNGGGPSGGPILKLKGKDVDLFFHLTGVRPGTILERGSIAAFTGYAAPTLATKVDIRVISPSGVERRIAAPTNRFGWFCQPASNFLLEESGVWRVVVKATNDGTTSAGRLQPPYPTGDVLGSRDGEFNFYVVDAASPAAAVDVPASSYPDIIAAPLRISSPFGDRLTYTVTAAGYIIEEGSTPLMAYSYDLGNLALTFPHLDRFDQDGHFASDTVTISLVVDSVGAHGERVYRARQLTLQGEQLLAPAQTAQPDPPRKRAVRNAGF